MRTRRQFTAEFKTQRMLEVLSEEQDRSGDLRRISAQTRPADPLESQLCRACFRHLCRQYRQ